VCQNVLSFDVGDEYERDEEYENENGTLDEENESGIPDEDTIAEDFNNFKKKAYYERIADNIFP